MIVKLGEERRRVRLITIRAKKGLQDDTEVLRRALLKLKGERLRPDCGHHITAGHFLGNEIII